MIAYEEMTGAGMLGSGLTGMKQTIWEFRQKIPFFPKTYLGREVLEQEAQSIVAEMNQAQKVRKAKITTEYFRWLAVKKKLKIKKEEELLLAQLIAVQQTRYLSQKVSQVELVALQIERGNLLTEITELESEDKKQQVALEILIGPGESLSGFEPKDQKLNLKPVFLGAPEKIAESLNKNSLELAAANAMSKRGQSNLSRAKAAWVPDLEVMVSKREDDLGNKQEGWQVAVEIPLWLAGEPRARVSQARAEAQNLETAYIEKMRQLQLEAQVMLTDQKQLRKQLELMENGLVQWSNQNVKSARIAYQTGKLEYASFLALMQSAYQTLISYEDLKVKVLDNQEQLQVLMGDI
jgi:outer membrane protein TolC